MLVPVLFGVSIFIFLMMRVVPGDVAQTILGTDATPQALEVLRNQFGLNDSYFKQYVNWMGGVLTGDFGESMRNGREVLPEIINRFKITFELTIIAAIISWIISIPLDV